MHPRTRPTTPDVPPALADASAARDTTLRWPPLMLTLFDYLDYLVQRFNEDHCTRAASALAYTTLLALVPLLTVVFITLSAVPAFADWQGLLEGFIFDNFVPAFGETVRTYLTDFAGKARGLQAVGVISLGVTVLLMMATVENTFNVIWRVRKRRPLVMRFMVYWAVLTLGPLLIGSGLVATSYIVALPQLDSVNKSLGLGRILLGAFPYLTTFVAFVLFFSLIPNRPVPLRHAIVGAVASSVLFEVAKRGFAFYVSTFPGQELIYGAFATLPLFLLWIYLSWVIILLGAEITVCLTTFNALAPRRRDDQRNQDFHAAFRVLATLYTARAEGELLDEKALVARMPSVPYTRFAHALERLEALGWVVRGENFRLLLALDLARLTLGDLARHIPPLLPAADGVETATGAQAARRTQVQMDAIDTVLGAQLGALAACAAGTLTQSLAEVLAPLAPVGGADLAGEADSSGDASHTGQAVATGI